MFLAAMFTLAGLGSLIYALWQAGLQLRNFGPVMAWESFMWPGLLALAALVCAMILGLAALRRKSKSLAIFQNGFVLRERGVTHAWRWEEVDAITSRVTRNYLVGIYSGTRHHYIIRRVDGSEMTLDDSIFHVGQAARFIQQETFQGRFDAVVRKIESGESVPFGPFLLASGDFRMGEMAYDWSGLKGVEMRNGKLTIDGKTKISLRVDEIPNLDVLVTILLQNVQP